MTGVDWSTVSYSEQLKENSFTVVCVVISTAMSSYKYLESIGMITYLLCS